MNGIGSLQQFPAAADAVGTQSTSKTAQTDASAPAGASRLTPSTNGADNAKVSTTANAVAQALAGSDVRTDRVTALQSAIGAGTYKVPASDVASKLLGALLS